MRNNNERSVLRIARRTLIADTRRSFFIVMAVMLTTALLAVSFSVGLSMRASARMQGVRLRGSVADGFIANPTRAQIDALRARKDVAAAGVGVGVGSVDGRDRQAIGNIGLTLAWIDPVQWQEINAPAFSEIAGAYPSVENEIMLSRWTLEHMGISQPELGMEIPLSWTAGSGDAEESFETRFILSGYFTNYYYARSGGSDFALVSEALADRHGCTAEKMGSVNLVFRDGKKPAEVAADIEAALGLTPGTLILNNSNDSNESGGFSPGALIALGALALVFSLCGFLLIYNTMLISLSRDTRFYGQLKTIGMTSEQLIRVVLYTVLILCGAGIPLGLALAALFSRAVVPRMVAANGIVTGSVVSGSPLIGLGAAIFSAATALAAALIPARKVARMSPIESRGYTEAIGNASFFRALRHAPKPVSLAARNLLRGGRRCALVLASLSLSIVTLVVTATAVSGIDARAYANSMLDCDIRLHNAATEIHIGTDVFSADLLERIRAFPGLRSMRTLTEAYVRLDTEDALIPLYGVDAETMREACEPLALPGDPPLRIDAFERGEFAVLGADNSDEAEAWKDVRMVSGELVSGVSELGKAFSLPIGPFILPGGSIPGVNSMRYILVSNRYLYEIADALQIKQVDLDFEEGYDEEAYFTLRELARSDNNISLSARAEYRRSIGESIALLSILGGSISLVFGIAGLLNYVNVMAVGVFTRRRELTLLECVGMSCAQVRAMLLLEGALYGLLSFAAGGAAGHLLVLALYHLVLVKIEYFSFHYPAALLGIFLAAMGLVCLAAPLAAYRSIRGGTLAERLRETE